MFSRRFLIWLGLVITPFLIMVIVNEAREQPSAKKEIKCSRYCHNHSCPHFRKKLKANPSDWNKKIKKSFDRDVTALHKNPLSLSYQNINILVYVLGFPTIMAILLWGVLRKPR